ncbi:hypothetical protein [Oscillibacter valericigenes]|uniref:hypothetical protein n=1 Tax=Oscillibacter valericigenes TaxID=351091 RepID=UPI00195D7AE8|nr:hypothetical protein [Oscillibacter valericigenes]MBM6909113.1 hypothetical protein [Oscillibacter valericigenes]
MERQIEIIPFLSRVVQENTHAYQEDFDYDVRKITRAVQESNMEDRTFYWMSRPCGTWCVKERDVFLRETDEHIIWTHFASEADGIRAYRIVITGHRDGTAIGNVFPLHYREQVQRIQQAALPVATVEITYPNGHTSKLAYAEFEKCRRHLYERYGKPERIRYAPENEAELTKRIMLEHRFQKGWKRKNRTQAPKTPSR